MSISGTTIAGLNDLLPSLNFGDLLRGRKAKNLMGDLSEELSVAALADNAALAAQAPPTGMEKRLGALSGDGQTTPLSRNPQSYLNTQSLLSGNFVSAGSDDSRYISAAKNSFAVNKMIRQQENNSLAQQLEVMKSYAGGSEARTKMLLRRLAAKKVLEESEADLKKSREDLEAKAQEALAAKDAKGNPIAQVGDTNQMPVADADTVSPTALAVPSDETAATAGLTDAPSTTAADVAAASDSPASAAAETIASAIPAAYMAHAATTHAQISVSIVV